jgi:hypothetical protein
VVNPADDGAPMIEALTGTVGDTLARPGYP